MKFFSRVLMGKIAAILIGGGSLSAQAFCGFYVSKVTSKLFNKASQVVVVREDNKTAITMAADYQGDVKDFALVVPVPEVITKERVSVADPVLIERIDSFTAPRLVEYFDDDPCAPVMRYMVGQSAQDGVPHNGPRKKNYGVTVHASFVVGEYDIKVLGAKESQGLMDWLSENQYQVSPTAKDLLGSYIKQKMKFFVARIDLKNYEAQGFKHLRPLQFAFESKKFMLPIRLGMANTSENTSQDMIVYAITRKGRVEPTNYPLVTMKANMELPAFVEKDFESIYKLAFTRAFEREKKRAVFLEYAWNLGWCDPCVADPLTQEELRRLGVFWLQNNQSIQAQTPPLVPDQAVDAFVTRLHVRYQPREFQEDLFFKLTPNQANFQARYVLRRPWTQGGTCEAMESYLEVQKRKQQQRAQSLARLTGWELSDIYKKMSYVPPKEKKKKWYENIFK